MSAPEWAQVVSALAALGATFAAWRAVLAATRQQRQREEPFLTFDLVNLGNKPMISVENIGGGIARKASFRFMTEDGRMAAGWLSTNGRLRPGARVDVLLTIPGEDLNAARCMTLGLDRWHHVHAWSSEGEHRSWSQRRWARRHQSDRSAFEEFYPLTDTSGPPTLQHALSPALSPGENPPESRDTGATT
jgi:hypothetical protein